MSYKDLTKRRITHRIARKVRYERNKAFVSGIKESMPCTDCKQKYPACVMDFDHLRDKLESVSVLAKGRSLNRIKAEIAKCELVCSNCHRLRTYKRRGV